MHKQLQYDSLSICYVHSVLPWRKVWKFIFQLLFTPHIETHKIFPTSMPQLVFLLSIFCTPDKALGYITITTTNTGLK